MTDSLVFSFAGICGRVSGSAMDLSVANATKGAWYTVYTNDAVSGTYRAAVSLRAEADGLLEFKGIDADEDVKFVRVGAGDAQVSAGTPLGF